MELWACTAWRPSSGGCLAPHCTWREQQGSTLFLLGPPLDCRQSGALQQQGSRPSAASMPASTWGAAHKQKTNNRVRGPRQLPDRVALDAH